MVVVGLESGWWASIIDECHEMWNQQRSMRSFDVASPFCLSSTSMFQPEGAFGVTWLAVDLYHTQFIVMYRIGIA